jgi:hypothetical protein
VIGISPTGWVAVFGCAVAALALGLLFSGWVLGGRPDLARVSIEGDRLMVRPRGMARLMAFHRSLRLDRTAIRQVAVIDRGGIPALGLRIRATGMPGLQAGMFSSSNQTGIVFMLVGRADKLVRIDLSLGKIRYLVVQVADPDSLAAQLLAGCRG